VKLEVAAVAAVAMVAMVAPVVLAAPVANLEMEEDEQHRSATRCLPRRHPNSTQSAPEL